MLVAEDMEPVGEDMRMMRTAGGDIRMMDMVVAYTEMYMERSMKDTSICCELAAVYRAGRGLAL